MLQELFAVFKNTAKYTLKVLIQGVMQQERKISKYKRCNVGSDMFKCIASSTA